MEPNSGPAAHQEWVLEDECSATASHLDLSGRQLTALPARLAICACAVELYASANSLTTLDAHVLPQSLELLDVSFNQLAVLPPEIKGLTRLRVLDVSYNHLQALPVEIGALAQLQQLRLHDNRIAALPAAAALKALTRLQVLDVEHNVLRNLPWGLNTALPALTDLRCGGNPVSERRLLASCAGATPPAQQVQASPEILILDQGTEPSCSTSGQYVDVDSDGPGIELRGVSAVSDQQQQQQQQGTVSRDESAQLPAGLSQALLDDLQDLPPAAAAALYRSVMAVRVGMEELRAGRPLSRAGVSGARLSTAPPPTAQARRPSTGVSSHVRTGTAAAGLGRSGAAVTRNIHEQEGGWTRPAWLPGKDAEPRGVQALLARPGTAAGGRVGESCTRPGALSGVAGLGSGSEAQAACTSAITYPLAAGLGSMLRKTGRESRAEGRGAGRAGVVAQDQESVVRMALCMPCRQPDVQAPR